MNAFDALLSHPVPAAGSTRSSTVVQAEFMGQLRRAARAMAGREGQLTSRAGEQVHVRSGNDQVVLICGPDAVVLRGNVDVASSQEGFVRAAGADYGFDGQTWGVPDGVLAVWTRRLLGAGATITADGAGPAMPSAPATPLDALRSTSADLMSKLTGRVGEGVLAEASPSRRSKVNQMLETINKIGGAEGLDEQTLFAGVEAILGAEGDGPGTMFDALDKLPDTDSGQLRVPDAPPSGPAAPAPAGEDKTGEGTPRPVEQNAKLEGVEKLKAVAAIEPPPREKSSTGLLTEDQQKELDEALEELNSLVGLDEIKDEINTQVANLKFRLLQEKAGLKTASVTQHMVFLGNPGTGKTTVARLLGKIYHALGVLAKGHLIETNRGGLVAGFEGQTDGKVAEVVADALDGVLFVDEAYALSPDGPNGSAFGKQALDALMQYMENYRDRIIVVFAGYTKPMQRMLDSNPGMRSRIPKLLNFQDYSPDQLAEIFGLMAGGAGRTVCGDVKTRVHRIAEAMVATSDPDSFGNARTMRNLLDRVIEMQALRIVETDDAKDGTVEAETLQTLTLQDVDSGHARCSSYHVEAEKLREMQAKVEAAGAIDDAVQAADAAAAAKASAAASEPVGEPEQASA